MTDSERQLLINAASAHKKYGKTDWQAVAEYMRDKTGIVFSSEQWRCKYRCITHAFHRNRDKTQQSEQEDNPPKVVVQNFEPANIHVNWQGNQHISFAIVGDTHINSKYTQLTYLHRFYEECARQGIKHVYHTGDIDEGEQMRPGHQYECYNQGADDHVAEICRVYPHIDGITTHFITGNHDASIIKRCGHNIGTAIAERRKDMEYLGPDCAVVHLTPNCTLELRHPWDGTAYSISYKPQKMIEAMSGGEKPNIIAIGHYHKAEYLFYRNVHSFLSGTFCAQTPYMRGKGISAHMGGWIINIDVDAHGYVQKINPQFIPYYVAIPDDYKNWRV